MELVELTESAQDEVARLLEKEDLKGKGLRIGVKGGGCSGLSYILDFDKKQEKDKVIKGNRFDIYVDPKSTLYLTGITVDYKDGLLDKGFKFINPNATRSCSCGESFSA